MAKKRLLDGRVHRYISSVLEVVGYDGVQVVTSEIFKARHGEVLAAATTAAPTEDVTERLQEYGYDALAWAAHPIHLVRP
jgi:hypothetical protein